MMNLETRINPGKYSQGYLYSLELRDLIIIINLITIHYADPVGGLPYGMDGNARRLA